ncbi:MAG: phosphatidylserine decarboxylase [Alphaproteobacteria bacterium]|nr:phosphatidylserine decarboxylase [Alphaproteobacteria bacterium]
MIGAFCSIFVPIHQEGYRFIFPSLFLTLFLFFFLGVWGWAGLGLTLLLICFFRDPSRVVPQRDGLVISPADGRVTMIEQVVPPHELDLGEVPRLRISIFLNIFDVHVNRFPLSGHVRKIVYRKGLFFSANLDKASKDNERNSVIIETVSGESIAVVQIAGFIARRIVCFTHEGCDADVGKRFGFIRFGSRVDVYLPSRKVACVSVGQLVVGGETILADLNSAEPERSVRVI